MDDQNYRTNGTVSPQGPTDSLESIDDNQTVSFYSSADSAFPVENLEVHETRDMGNRAASPIKKNFAFSRRKAMVISTVITLLVILLTAATMLLFIRNSPKKDNASKLTPAQDIVLKDASKSTVPQELQGAAQSLIVNGDIITRGAIKVSDGSNVTVLRLQSGGSANQAITLPNSSGTICLDSNNCGFAGLTDLTGLQGRVGTLEDTVAALSQVTAPTAGVTELNSQKGSVSIQGSLNQISVNTNNGVLTLSTPQNLDANANVQFGSLTVSPTGEIKANKLIQTGAGNSINIDAGNDFITFTAGGRVFQLPNSGGAAQTICTTGASCASGGGTAVLLAPGTVQNDSSPDASIFINDTGGGNLLQLQSGGVDKLTVASNGNTTVGGSLTVSGLGSGFVKSASGALSVVSAINLASGDVINTLPASNGGTGLNTIPANGVLVGNGASPVSSVVAAGSGLCLMSTAGAPSFQACPGGGGVTSVNSQTGALTVAGTANQINVSTAAGTITLSTPQNIHVGAAPTFAGLTLSSLGTGPVKASAGLLGTGNINLGSEVAGLLGVTNGGTGVSTTPSNGQLLIGNGTGYTVATLTAGAGVSITNGGGSITISAPASGSCATCANQALSNLSGVALNTSLLTGSTTIDLGSNAAPFRDLYLGGSATNNFRFTGVATAARTITVPNASGTLAISASGNIALDVAGNLTITGQIPLANGGTNATTAAGARTNLGAAASGANSDITSTTALNTITPSSTLTIGATGQVLSLQGNGSSTFSAGSGANITTLGFAAPSGLNTITFPAASGTVCLSSGNCTAGGSAGGDLTGSYPNPTIAKLQGTNLNISGAAAGNVLIYNATNSRWENHAVTSDITLSETGTATIANNAVTTSKIADGNVTNVKLANSSLTVTAGNGLSGGGAVSLGASTSLAVVYGSTANTAVQGNTAITLTAGTGLSGGGSITLGAGGSSTLNVVYGSTANTAVEGNKTLTCASGTGNLTGGGNVVTLGAGGTCNNLTITNSPVFSGTLAVQGATATIGASGQQGSAVLYDGGVGGAANTGTVQVIGSLGQNTTYILPDPAGATATICLSTGNCAGAGGGITGSGTSGKLAKFTGAGTIADSTLSESGSTVTATGNVVIQGSNSLTLGTSSTFDGSIKFYNAAGTHFVALQAPASDPAADLTFKLPSSYGSNGDCLQSNGSGTLTFTSCTGGAGGGVTSINSQTGVVSIANATASAGVVTLNDASTTGKGIAQFNSTNFSVASGVVNTIQNIATSATPSFTGLTLSGLGVGLVKSDGAGSLSSGTVSRNDGTYLTGTLNATNGGTGQSSYTTGDLLYANSGTTLGKLAAVAAGQCLVSNGIGTAPSWSVCPGSGGVASVNTFTGAVTVQGTTNQVIVNNNTGTITLSTPQDINTSSTPQFSGLGLTGTATFSGVATDITTGSNEDLTINANGTGKTILSDAVDVAGLLSANGGIQTNGAGIATSNGALTLGSGNLTTTGTITAGLINGQTISSTANFTGTVSIQGASSLSLGTSSSLDGSIAFRNAAGTHTVSLQAPTTDPTANFTLKLPSAAGGNNDCLKTDASGNLFFGGCAAAGSGVTSLDTLSGALTIANSSGVGSTITIDDATTAAKGIASFSSTNFAVTGGAVSIKTGGVGSAEIADGSVTNTDLQNSSVTVTAGGGLTNGGSVSLGGSTTLDIGAGDGITVNVNDVAVDATVCRTTGNCAGVGGTGDVLQGGNTVAATMTIGTNNAFDLGLETNNTTRLTISSTGVATFTGAVNAVSFAGDGASLTNLNASNLASGTVATGRISGSYTGITGVGTITTGTWQGSAIADAYLQDNITVSSAGIVDWTALNNYPAACPGGQAITQLGDTITCTAFAAGSGSGNYIQNQSASQQTTSSFWISGTGRSDTSFTAPLFDTPTAVALNIGTTNATAINLNQNVTVAASKTFTVTSGATSLTGATTGDAVTISNNTSTGNIAVFKDNATTVATFADGGAVTFQNSVDSASAFKIKTAAGGNVFTVNTLTSAIGINVASPQAPLHVGVDAGGLFTDGFEDGTMTPFVVVSSNWSVVSTGANSGTYTAKANNSGSAAMELTKTLTSAGNISFARSVSSEAGFDFLRFYIDGVEQQNWSGVSGWGNVNFPVAVGTHTFRWAYTKDSSGNFNADTAWVDDVQITNVAGTALSAIFDGNVGIGTTSPSTALEVNGTVLATTVQAATFDTGSAVALNVGTTNATQINLNKNVVVAASQSLTITGGATGTRPASPTEGMLYYDTTTKQLLFYANGKWQADRESNTKIIAPSNASQAAKDAADVVLTGTADQTLINTALTAAAGGKVYILEGTVNITAAISIPNNTTLSGAGMGTLITIPNAQNGSYAAITSTDSSTGTNIIIQDLRLDGNKSNQTSGTMNGISLTNFGGGSGASARPGARIINVTVMNWFGGAGILLGGGANTTVTGSTSQANGTTGLQMSGSNDTLVNNNFQGNTLNGIYNTSGTGNTISGNTFQGNGGAGFISDGDRNTITGNTFSANNVGVRLNSSNNTVSGNLVQGNTGQGIYLTTGSNNLVSGNKVYDTGSATTNNAIYLTNSDSNTITANSVFDTSCTTNCYAVSITDAASDTNYLAGNTLGGGTINDAGTGTIYGGQVNNSGNFQIQPAGTIELMKNTNVTGNLAVTGTGSFTGGNVTIATATATDDRIKVVVATGGAARFDGTITNADLTVARTWTLPDEDGTFCLRNSTNCGFATSTGSGNYVQNQSASQQASSSFWISGTGRSDTSFTAPLFDTPTAVALNIGTTNATQINLNKNVVVAASQSLAITGGITSTRPASPTEGMLYYDTTTKQLLVYANGKWQADRSPATKIIAPSNASQTAKDSADVVLTGTADQTLINTALTAAAGGKVYILEGTVSVTGAISVPNNTTLAGAGPGTVITIPNAQNGSYHIIENTDTSTGTHVIIRDLQIDGNKANQTSGAMVGVYLNQVGNSTGTRDGGLINGVIIKNIYTTGASGNGIQLNAGHNTTISNSTFSGNPGVAVYITASNADSVTGNTFLGNAYDIQLSTATNTAITGNVFQGNTVYSIDLQASSTNNTISGNAFKSGANAAIRTGSDYTTISGNSISGMSSNGISVLSSNNNISGNTVQSASSNGIYLGGNNNVASTNKLHDNGGGTANNAIFVTGGDSNTITGNSITDSSCTSTCYAINVSNSTSDTNYLADNTLGSGTINDAGTGTVYGGQVNGSGNFVIQPAGTIELMKSTNITGSLTVTNAGNVAFQKGSDYSATGITNDVNFGTGALFRLTGASVQTITGIAGGADGRMITLVNAATQSAVISNNSGSSLAANRIITGTGSDLTIAAGASISMVYDSGASLWRVVGSASAVGGGVYVNLQGSTPGTADVGNFNITGTGIAANLQGTTSVKTPLVDVVSAGTLSVGTATATAVSISKAGVTTTVNGALTVTQAATFNGATTFNSSVTVAASQSLTITGGATGTRPGSPTEGMLYYDTTTKKLLVYSNGKWQADRHEAILVAASNSSQADKDAADYVATGTGDQAAINSALTDADPAGTGSKTGKVYLFAGTYVANATILIPNNTTLAGTGRGTVIELADLDATDNLIENSDTSTGSGVTIQDIQLDGRNDLNTSGTQHAVYLNNMGLTTSPVRPGAKISNLWVKRFRSGGIWLQAGGNSTVSNNIIEKTQQGLVLSGSINNTLTGNIVRDNTSDGITIQSSATTNTIVGNIISGNLFGIYLNASDNTVSGNTVMGNATYGLFIVSSQRGVVSGNKFTNNGGNTDNNAIYLSGSDSNTITGNSISDTSATTTNYAINISDSSSNTNYLANNSLGTGSINNIGTGTVYGGQVNSSGNYQIQPAGTVELMKNTNVTGTLTATTLVSTVATGTAPLTVASTTVVTNLNADLLDGQTGSFYQDAGNITAGTLSVSRGGSGAGTFTQYGVLFGNGTGAFGVTATGSTGQCLISGNGTAAPSWGTCTVSSLQSVYNASSPADITLTDAKNISFTAADTATDPSIVMKLNCTACGTGTTGNFIIQNNSSAALFSVAGSGAIQIGTASNGISLGGSGGTTTGSFTLSGTARNAKSIILAPEFAGAVLDAASDTGGANCSTNNNGTMTSGFDSASRMNNYQWTSTQTTDQCYDVVVQVPIPSDWSAWDSTNSIDVQLKKNSVGSAAYAIGIVDSSGTADANYGAAYTSPGTLATSWGDMATSNLSGTYTAGGYMTIKIRMTAKQVTAQNGILYLGNITLNYLSKF